VAPSFPATKCSVAEFLSCTISKKTWDNFSETGADVNREESSLLW